MTVLNKIATLVKKTEAEKDPVKRNKYRAVLRQTLNKLQERGK